MEHSFKISNCGFSKNCTGYFEYDIEGYVATLLDDNPHESKVAERYKRIDYYYDLLSGNMNELIYQHDSADQFMQIYEYDADNRITNAITSRDSVYFENDASFEYYDHGPLAREVLGQRQVQGIDYAYTLNGWLKGKNSSILNPTYDMGLDGNVHNGATASIGRDALGFTLEYFTGDYRAIGSSKFEAYGLPDTNLYNGNIAGATYSIKPILPKTIGYKYTYDQLNRLNDLVAFTAIDTVNDKWNSPASIASFQEKVAYDENGNIFKYLRHGNTIAGMPLAMDSLNYYYNKGTNQINYVTDGVPSTNYPNDLHNESSNNYSYNKIGQLAKDVWGGIDSITWTVYGKIKKVMKYNNDSIVFEYNGLGNRIEKRYYPHSGTADTTLYAWDAQGNILATYDRKRDTVRLTEWDMYSHKHLGTLDTTMRVYPKANINAGGSIDSSTVAYLENQKQYELDNHLGNVMVVISDKKRPIDTTATANVANYYMPNIISAQDYYPFGMEEPGRTYQLTQDSVYRYAFNDKLKTDEIYGTANAYDYGMRYYDVRLGRFMSVDPIADKFPHYSPYMFAGDKPVMNVDMDGLEDITPKTDGYEYDDLDNPLHKGDRDDKIPYPIIRVDVLHPARTGKIPEMQYPINYSTNLTGDANHNSFSFDAYIIQPTIASGPFQGLRVQKGTLDFKLTPTKGQTRIPHIIIEIWDKSTNKVVKRLWDNNSNAKKSPTLQYNLKKNEEIVIINQSGDAASFTLKGNGVPLKPKDVKRGPEPPHNGIIDKDAAKDSKDGKPNDGGKGNNNGNNK